MSAATDRGKSANRDAADRCPCRETTRTIATMSGWGQAGLSAALLAAYAVPYAVRARTLRRRGRPVPAWRLGCFGLALMLLVFAVSPFVDRAADERLSAHMVE